jgi:hypothetical protein
VAELATSLTVQIGVERTAGSAVAGLGAPTVAAAGAHVQPLAVTGPTQATVRHYEGSARGDAPACTPT